MEKITQEDYYRSETELIKNFVSEELSENQVIELLMYDPTFKALFECMLRGKSPYWAITVLTKQLIEQDKRMKDLIERLPMNPIVIPKEDFPLHD